LVPFDATGNSTHRQPISSSGAKVRSRGAITETSTPRSISIRSKPRR